VVFHAAVTLLFRWLLALGFPPPVLAVSASSPSSIHVEAVTSIVGAGDARGALRPPRPLWIRATRRTLETTPYLLGLAFTLDVFVKEARRSSRA
jgi:hypothetical protein